MRFPRRDAFRKRSHYLAALASEAAAPLLRTAARVWCRPPSQPAEWRRGLIIGHNHIGDVLYRTASLPHLASALPNCAWDYLTTPQSADLLAGNPYLASVLPFARGDESWNLSRDHLRALSGNAYDVALCTNSVAHHPDIALAVTLRIGSRVAFDYKGLSGLITHPVPIAYPSPYPAYFRGMVAHIGGLEPRWSLRPQLFVSDTDESAAAARWSNMGLGRVPVIACTFTTRQRVPVWPPREYMRALRLVRESMQADVVLCGGPADRPLLEQIANDAPFPCALLAGDLSLRAFAAFLRRCSVLLSTDSGPRHIANAMGTPVVFIRGIAGSRIEPGAYCDSEIDLAPDAEFVPPEDIPRALESVRAEVVADALVTILSRERAPESQRETAGRGASRVSR